MTPLGSGPVRRLLWPLGVSAGLLGAGKPAGTSRFAAVPASQSGIHWTHENARSEQRYLPETVGAGCAFLDFDQDGWMDLYFVNSGPADFFRPSTPLRNALFRNDGDGTFSDVTQKAGVSGGTFGMGAAASDYDGDGDPDLFLTGYGRTILYRNEGDGTFADVTAKAGVLVAGWTTCAVWFDFDADGALDLFVGRYVDYALGGGAICGMNTLGRPYYCTPRGFVGNPGLLFQNNGDGTFTEVGRRGAIGRSVGKALGVVATDVNNDGWMDLFVANDTAPNFLFLNRGGGGWEETGLAAEVAYDANGKARSGMGLDSADVDGDGWQDLFVANIDHERFSLYRNSRDGSFSDDANLHGIGEDTRYLSGWGLKFFDHDNDGWTDLLLANGHPDDMVGEYNQKVQYREPLLLYENREGRLVNASAEAGPAFAVPFAARGLATGDLDNDGRADVVVTMSGDAPLLLRNQCARGHHWLGLRLRGRTRNRDAVGAVIRWSAGGVVRSRLKTSGGSYLSSHDPREVIGLGEAAGLDWLEIQWPRPGGKQQRLERLPIDRYVTVDEDAGIVG